MAGHHSRIGCSGTTRAHGKNLDPAQMGGGRRRGQGQGGYVMLIAACHSVRVRQAPPGHMARISIANRPGGGKDRVSARFYCAAQAKSGTSRAHGQDLNAISMPSWQLVTDLRWGGGQARDAGGGGTECTLTGCPTSQQGHRSDTITVCSASLAVPHIATSMSTLLRFKFSPTPFTQRTCPAVLCDVVVSVPRPNHSRTNNCSRPD
jgi:hypothetical protein